MHVFMLWAIPVAALSGFALGGLWFSPLALGALQEREMRKRGATAPPATPRIFVLSFLLTLVEASGFAWLLEITEPSFGGLPAGVFGILAGSCFAAASTGINYLYTGRGGVLWLVDGGFHVARFALYGFVLGTWLPA